MDSLFLSLVPALSPVLTDINRTIQLSNCKLLVAFKKYLSALGTSAWQMQSESRAPNWLLDTTWNIQGHFGLCPRWYSH